jgi:predicted DNA-binding transcriptional regulator AlpA
MRGAAEPKSRFSPLLNETPSNDEAPMPTPTPLQTLKEFLADNRISRATWYRHMSDRPKVIRMGRKILIRAEEVEAWRKRMEQAER